MRIIIYFHHSHEQNLSLGAVVKQGKRSNSREDIIGYFHCHGAVLHDEKESCLKISYDIEDIITATC